MSAWTHEELRRIDDVEELQIAPAFRACGRDSATLPWHEQAGLANAAAPAPAPKESDGQAGPLVLDLSNAPADRIPTAAVEVKMLSADVVRS
jgi:hypothetical protein